MWSMTKKRSSEILANENRKMFREKITFRKFSPESEYLSKIGGNMKQGENVSGVLGLILVLKGIRYTGLFHSGDRLILSPDSLSGWNITGHRPGSRHRK